MKKIYISGQITGLSVSKFKSNFLLAKSKLYWSTPLDDYGDEASIINPLDLKPFLGVKSWLCYMITDVCHLRKCTHIAMQNNWIYSKGAVIEYFIAKFILKLEVIWL